MASLTDRPIFVSGCPKSGTSLAVRLLNNHPDIQLEYEIWMAQEYINWYEKALKMPLVVKELDDGLFAEDAKRIYENFKKRSRLFFRGFYQASSFNKRWGCGTKYLIFNYDTLQEFFPESVFLLIMRDPRDVYCSLKLMSAKYVTWVNDFDKFIAFHNRWAAYVGKKNVITVKYEDMLSNPKVIYEVLGETPPEDMTKGIGKVYQKRTKQLERPQDVKDQLYNRVGRWKQELDPALLSRITSECKVFQSGLYQP